MVEARSFAVWAIEDEREISAEISWIDLNSSSEAPAMVCTSSRAALEARDNAFGALAPAVPATFAMLSADWRSSLEAEKTPLHDLAHRSLEVGGQRLDELAPLLGLHFLLARVLRRLALLFEHGVLLDALHRPADLADLVAPLRRLDLGIEFTVGDLAQRRDQIAQGPGDRGGE